MNKGTKLAWLNRDIWLKLRTKRRVYDFLKKEQSKQKDNEGILRLYGEKMRRDKS